MFVCVINAPARESWKSRKSCKYATHFSQPASIWPRAILLHCQFNGVEMPGEEKLLLPLESGKPEQAHR